ncbi:hypothetical protein VM99_24475 [Pseudomonas chlororaphis]|uniref:Uncharacterized protein n=1 Tax=Pseudomonas chlororaphis TaxID=587753 RepID=A0A0G3GNB3_9PSED|nr:hypothetical protein VM99_24475 [Pseudomonas chlororaphis]
MGRRLLSRCCCFLPGRRFVLEHAVDLDPVDEQQTTLQAGAWLALFDAFLVEKRINPQIADTKRQQHLFLGIDGVHVEANQAFSFAPSDLAIEASVFHRIGRTVQSCNIAGHERLSAANLYFTHTVEVANAGGM